MAGIRFEHVSYTYPSADRPALYDVSLEIAPGEFVLVAGTSGSGKSTFLRCINGLVPHFYGGRFGGRVVVDGRDTREHDPRQLAASVGFVFQDPEAQMVVEVVEDELVFGMENLGVAPVVMRRRVEEVLDQLEIAHLRRRRLATLSGGERQRVAIAAVLAMQPQILVLDEPTSQLDPHTAEEVLTALQKLNSDLGLTVVLSEHRLERVVQYADRLIAFEPTATDGPQVAIGGPRAILARSPLAPPLVQLGRSLGWEPLPLTIKDGRRFVEAQALDPVEALPTSAPAKAQGMGVRLRERLFPSAAPSTAPAALSVEGLSVRRGSDEVLHRVTLDFAANTLTAVMGRNGSGKTTLLRAIIGLDPAAHGRLRLSGQDITALPVEARAARVGYVPQDPRTLLFHETVADELRWTLRERGVAPAQIEARVTTTLTQLRIAHLADAHPREISGGEQQRAALAAILVAQPEIVLLDEPTRGLDYASKGLLITLLAEFRAAGKTIVLVTHDVELVAACADRIVLLGGGDVVVAGAPQELLNSSLIFSSQIGKLFRNQPWLTVDDALAGLRQAGPAQSQG
jgi:energy-coupling factor transport system ATP-binding protein